MTRKLFVGTLLALVMTWGGTAMGQIADQCELTGDAQQILTFPYFAGTLSTDGWWGGLAIINTTGTAIPASDLCVVGVTGAEQTGVNLPAELGGNSMYVNLVEGLNESFGTPQTALSVFSNNDNAKNLRGFGMVGDGTQGQGYLALQGDNAGGLNKIEFPYVPGTDNGTWWRGMAIFNNAGEAQMLTFNVYYADGTTEEDPITKEIAKDAMTVALLDDILPEGAADKRSRIVVEGDKGKIFGFAMFGNGQEAQGLVAPN